MGEKLSQYEIDMMAVRDRLSRQSEEEIGLLQANQDSIDTLCRIYDRIESIEEHLYEMKEHLMRSSENTAMMVDILRETSRMGRKSSAKNDDPGET